MMISKPPDPRDVASRDDDEGLLNEVGGPVPDFLRPAQVLKSATDRIKDQLSSGTDGRGRAERAPVLKEEEGARLRRLLAEMTSAEPLEPAFVEDYQATTWRPARALAWRDGADAALSLWQGFTDWARRPIRSGPVLAACLLVVGGVAGAGISYFALSARAAVLSDACVSEACTVLVETVEQPIAAPVREATAAVAPTSVAVPAPPSAHPEVAAAVGAGASIEARGSVVPPPASTPSVLRPSRPDAALSLPAPPPLAIPAQAMSEPATEVATAPVPEQMSEDRETAVVDGDSLNVRDEPSKNSRKLFTLSSGEEVTVLEERDSWTHVRTSKAREGWVYSSVTDTLPRKLVPGSEPAKQRDTTSADVRVVKSGGVTVRSGPNKRNAAVFNLSGGARVTFLGQKDGWSHIRDDKGREGWAYGDYLSRS